MKRIFLRAAIGTTVIAIALMTFTLSGCSTRGASAGVKDGIIKLMKATLDFGDNRVPNSSKSAMTVIKLKKKDRPAGLASTMFELFIDVTCDLPVTISVPIDVDKTPVGEGEAVVLGVGTAVTIDEDVVDTTFTFIPAKVEDGVATSTFVPSEYLDPPSVQGAPGSAESSPERMTLGVFRVNTTVVGSGHFVLYFPKQGWNYPLNSDERNSLLSDLEDIYKEYLSKGYTYGKREKWPMGVYIQSLRRDGYYFYRRGKGAEGQIYLNQELFKEGYKSNAIRPLLAREFFHFVQLNYVEWGNTLPWFDTATAVYFEGQKAGSPPPLVSQYGHLIFSGVFPSGNDAANGYARQPLIEYLSQKLGEDFILKAYTAAGGGAGWEDALLSVVGAPSAWAGDFYKALVKGEIGRFSPSGLYKTLAEDKKGDGTKIGASLELAIPPAKELDALAAKGEEPVFGSATVSVDSFGAQLVAIAVNEKQLSHLPEGVDPAVSAQGTALSVFAIRGNAAEALGGGTVTLVDFKKEGSTTLYLVLVTGLHESGKKDYTVTVGLPTYPVLEEVVGEYPGSTMRFARVQISDEAMEAAQAGEDISGCDAQTLAMLKSMEGKEQKVTLIIEKSGENSGFLEIGMGGDPDDDDDEDDARVYPFTYSDGHLLFDTETDGEHTTGSLALSYGDEENVILDGTLNIAAGGGQVSLDLYFNGSKPLSDHKE